MKQNFPILTKHTGATPIELVMPKQFDAWLKKQPAERKAWLKANGFSGRHGEVCALPGKGGSIAAYLCGVEDTLTTWSIAHLPARLPAGAYALSTKLDKNQATQLALGWALACYKFDAYKSNPHPAPPLTGGGKNGAALTGGGKNGAALAGAGKKALVAPQGCDTAYVQSMTESMFWARDLINTPTNDMNTETLAGIAADWAKKAGGKVNVIKGEALLKANYPTIYTVGKASSSPPHLVDMTFARKGAPKVALVGKGVCFDSGGLDIKPSAAMRLMKKDMGGAAVTLAMARHIVEMKIPIELRVLLPIVENAVSANAMRPLDIVKTRKGITVEIGNTDAEGRLILCDALFEADSAKPDMIIDCATLTGAARVALGTDMPAFFTPDDALAAALQKHSNAEHDPMWRLPLHKPYRAMLDTPNADLSNDPDSGMGGAITAALYLQEFVSNTNAWIHIDMMAWNLSTRPGRPQGGEAMAVRAVCALLKDIYGS